ncbi:unnamed protein product, partial [Allacma fusca]
MKQIFDVTNEIVKDFVQSLLKECSDERIDVDFRNRVIVVLIDIIATGLYGIELHNRKDPNNNFVKILKTIL